MKRLIPLLGLALCVTVGRCQIWYLTHKIAITVRFTLARWHLQIAWRELKLARDCVFGEHPWLADNRCVTLAANPADKLGEDAWRNIP